MESRAVEYFLAVAEAGSFRAAAQQLGLTQPALTKAMRRLEDEAEAQLFDRGARGTTLTVYGEAMLRHARSLRATMREAREEIASLRGGIGGRVRVGAGPSWQKGILPRAIAAFRAERPAVRISVLGGDSSVLKDQLREGSLDLVLAVVPDARALEPDLDWAPLMEDEYRVIARRQHPLRAGPIRGLQALLDYPWILPGGRAPMVERLNIAFRAQGLAPPLPVIETDLPEMKIALMREDDYLSYHAVEHLAEIGDGSVLPLDVPHSTWRRAAGVITRRGSQPNPAAVALVRHIEAVCGRRPDKVAQLRSRELA